MTIVIRFAANCPDDEVGTSQSCSTGLICEKKIKEKESEKKTLQSLFQGEAV